MSDNPNTNCLEGMQCPRCGNYGPFHIAVTTVVNMADDGSQYVSGYGEEWNDDSHAWCPSPCDFDGAVRNFKKDPESA